MHNQPQRIVGGYRLMAFSTPTIPARLTIVTVVYNAVERLIFTFESVSALHRDDVQYIVVDGGSKDRTLEFLQTHNEQLAYWLSEPDHGIYNTMIKVIQLAAAGMYILFLGASDAIAGC